MRISISTTNLGPINKIASFFITIRPFLVRRIKIRPTSRIQDIHNISSTYRVRKMDDDNLYNEMDLNGNLLGEWIEDEDTK